MALNDEDRTMFGTKVRNNYTDELLVILYTWTDGTWACGKIVKTPYAACVDSYGNEYKLPLENLTIETK